MEVENKQKATFIICDQFNYEPNFFIPSLASSESYLVLEAGLSGAILALLNLREILQWL